MGRQLWVLDIDNTLIRGNTHDYSGPILESIRIIIRELGHLAPGVTEIAKLEDEIDRGRLKAIDPETDKPYLYSMRRFPGSLQEAYRQLCEKNHVLVKSYVLRELWSTGMQAFSPTLYRSKIDPAAVPLTSRLMSRGDAVILLTKGDPKVQQLKVNALREAGVLFRDAIIVESSKVEYFKELRESYPGTAFSVGDSYEGDIEPALDWGYQGVYLKVFNWESASKAAEWAAKAQARGCRIISELAELLEKSAS
jgi:FMN phosphatase YigB (HAD superfamily)